MGRKRPKQESLAAKRPKQESLGTKKSPAALKNQKSEKA
jgi:hypothetical protein